MGLTETPELSPAAMVLWRALVPALIGAATGAIIAGLTVLENWSLGQLIALPGSWAALFSPIALLATLLVFTFPTRMPKPATSELYIRTYHQDDPTLPLWQIPRRVLAALTTVCFGGSQGQESTSALIGGSLGELLHRGARIPSEERRTLLAAGASAGIAAVFSSPCAGVLYGIEVPFRNKVDATRLAPCAIAAASSWAVRFLVIGTRPIVAGQPIGQIDAIFLGACFLVAIACGVGARLFALSEGGLHALARWIAPWPRALSGGVFLGLLAWAGFGLTGKWITFGPGYVAADWATGTPHSGWVVALALIIRMGGNLACVYGGGGGGVFTSLACNGALIGQGIAAMIGRPEAVALPLLGAACFLGAGYRLPLACLLFLAEQAQDVQLVCIGAAALGMGQIIMGSASVSDAQT
jgi:CIC family chloride channel protein